MVLFLIKHCKVPANEILLLAFNRKAALEIRRRILKYIVIEKNIDLEINKELSKTKKNDNDFEKYQDEHNIINKIAGKYNVQLPYTMTFHSLAHSIVHPEQEILYNGSDSDSPGLLNREIQNIIDDHLRIPKNMEIIKNIMLGHFREDWEKIIGGRYLESRDDLLKYRKSLVNESLNGDFIKSYGEKVIANFLFEHDIPYKYERVFPWFGINYKPDFTIFNNIENESGLIIEYFGLKGDKDYDEMSQKKREYWSKNKKWNLIEFYPSDVSNPNFPEYIKDILKNKGFECTKLSDDEIWNKIKNRSIDRFTKTVTNFIGKCRKKLITNDNLSELIKNHEPLNSIESKFLKISKYFLYSYLERLENTGKDDFDGLLQSAISSILNNKTRFFKRSLKGDLIDLKFIFIDEYQDFSELFYRLIHAIKSINQKVTLFCVGDDWQAINSFAGSDLSYFQDFNKYFKNNANLNLSTNYRSYANIVDIGNALMKDKGIPSIAKKNQAGEVILVDLNDFQRNAIEKNKHRNDNLTPALLRIFNTYLDDDNHIVMLSRTNRINNNIYFPNDFNSKNRNLDNYLLYLRTNLNKNIANNLTISTSHKYKGLEKNIVIILDAYENSYPLIHPEWVFFRIFGENIDEIVEAERRLFYVALTRAIDKLIIITENSNPSPFLHEIQSQFKIHEIDWAIFSPPKGEKSDYILRITNQENRGSNPTYRIKDQIKSSHYQFFSKNNLKGWEKYVLSKNFDITKIKNEPWVLGADQVEFKILDETENVIAYFFINNGEWIEKFNKI